jgi:hypothetical protein
LNSGVRHDPLAALALMACITGCTSVPQPLGTPIPASVSAGIDTPVASVPLNTATPTHNPASLIPSRTEWPTSVLPEITLPTAWPADFTPTVRPTPTRGLPSTATSAPKADCPPPTGRSVSIPGMENPADYEQAILDSAAADGGLQAFRKNVEQILGKADASGPASIALFEEDVTLDGRKEFLISIGKPFGGSNPFADYRTAIFIVGCRGGRYEAIYRSIFDSEQTALSGRSGLRAVLDANANGIPEVVIYMVTHIRDRGVSSVTMQLLEWNGAAFRELVSTDPNERDRYGWTQSGQVLFEDRDGNGTMEIVIPQVVGGGSGSGAGVDCAGGPARDSANIWMWDGEYYHYAWREPTEPQYRFQAALDGDYFSFIGLYDRAERMYLRAVFDESLKPGSPGDWKKNGGCPLDESEQPDPAEPPRIQAYARFRLVELFVRAGRVMEGEWHRSYMRTNYPPGSPGYIYAYLANTFWWEYNNTEDIAAACGAVKREAERNSADVFALFGTYGYLNPGPTADDICPFTAPPAG